MLPRSFLRIQTLHVPCRCRCASGLSEGGGATRPPLCRVMCGFLWFCYAGKSLFFGGIHRSFSHPKHPKTMGEITSLMIIHDQYKASSRLLVWCVTTFCWLRVGSIPGDDGDSLGRAFSGPGFLLNHQLVTWEVYSYTPWFNAMKMATRSHELSPKMGNMPKIQKHAILVKQAHKHA